LTSFAYASTRSKPLFIELNAARLMF